MAANNYSGFSNDETSQGGPATGSTNSIAAFPLSTYEAYHAATALNPPLPPTVFGATTHVSGPGYGFGYDQGQLVQSYNWNGSSYNAATVAVAPIPPPPPSCNKIHYSAPPRRSLPQVRNSTQHKDRQKMQNARSKQLHYCEVCKISCSCPRAYTEHLGSKKHKKREAGLNAIPTGQAVSHNKFHCGLCDVLCTDKDAYAAHIRGSKHQKVVKLHTKLGKPIPKDDLLTKDETSLNPNAGNNVPSTIATDNSSIKVNPLESRESEIKPVGAEYIEEIKEDGKVVLFNCKLCDCKFSDPNAKEMHMKGRRHRLQYKRKVEPELVVEIKPTSRQKRLALVQGEMWNSRSSFFTGNKQCNDGDVMWPPRRFSDNDYTNSLTRTVMPNNRGPYMGGWSGSAVSPFAEMLPNLRPEGINDFYAIARHSEIYPKEKSLHNIHEIVSTTERGLRIVSDVLAGVSDSFADNVKPSARLEENKNGENGMANVSFPQVSDSGHTRILQGVMRVGLLAKGLLLQGDNCVQLVVLCSEKPSLALLERVASELTMQFKNICSHKTAYQVSVDLEDGSVSTTDGYITVKVSLTTPLFREEENSLNNSIAFKKENDCNDGFPIAAALQALAELRHSKWFQAKAAVLPSCVLVIRLMRDICQRFPAWQSLNQWALELLVEKVISSARFPLGPSDCLRRIMEAISTGLMINGPAIIDPCERDPCNVLHGLTVQQREDITHAAQQFLRFIAFKHIYKILGMDQMSTSKLKWKFWLLNRKRSCGSHDNEGGTDMKLKKTDT